jgi:hypothetical protein
MNNPMRRLATSILALAVGAGMAHAADTASADKIGIWAGHWKMQLEVKNTPFSHARTTTYDSTCSWAPIHGYMICDNLASKPDGEKENILSIFAYSDTEKAFKNYSIDKNGRAEAPHTTVDGNTWTFRYEENGEKGQKMQIRNTYKFVSPVKVLATSEYSVDGGQHWVMRSETIGTKLH